jgi:hypothetical protein
MLVLAMEFSRDAQHPFGAVHHQEQTGEEGRNVWARGRLTTRNSGGRLRVGGAELPPGCSKAGTEGHSLKTE